MSEIWTVTFLFAENGQAWKLVYSSEERARAAYVRATEQDVGQFPDDRIELADDFGLTITLDRRAAVATQLCHAQACLEGQSQVQLATMRAQVKFQKNCAVDPMLKVIPANMIPPGGFQQ
jgi:hypothetical protein